MKAKSPLSFLTRRKAGAAETDRHDAEERREQPRFDSRADHGHGTTRDSIGPLLRQTRESFGYDLQRISQALRIRYLYLDAIEKGNFERLPGPAYAVGFIRSYADFLGLDSDKILEFYKRDVHVPPPDSGFHFPEPVSETKVPGVAIIAICLVLAVVAYGAWYYASEPGSEVADAIPEVPDRLKVMLEPENKEVEQAIADAAAEPHGPASPTASQAEEAAAASAEQAETAAPAEASEGEAGAAANQAAPTEAPQVADTVTAAPQKGPSAMEGDEISALIDEMVGDEEGAPEPPSSTAETPAPGAEAPAEAAPASEGATAAAPADGGQLAEIPAVPRSGAGEAQALAPAPQVFGDAEAETRVVLRALEDCWVQVRDEKGNLLLTRVMRPGDVYRVPDKPNLTLLAGNAGGLEVVVDGRTLPPLGPPGVVRRDISLNVDALLGGTANLQ